MLKFGKTRTLAEIKKIAAEKPDSFMIDSAKYEHKDCSTDYIKVLFRHENAENKSLSIRGWALVSMFNGRFFGEYNVGKARKAQFSSDEFEHDSQDWFIALLNLVYHPLPEPVKS